MASRKKYNFSSIFKISLEVYPIYIVLLILAVVIGGLFIPINLKVMQIFIDQIIEIVKHNMSLTQVVPIFILILILQLYNNFNSTFENIVAIKFSQKVKKHFLSLIIDQIARLEYQYIENKETYDLIHRVKKGAENNIKESLGHLSKILSGTIGMIGLFIIIWQANLWISLAILFIILLTAFLAYRCGTREFEVSVAWSKVERQMEYYEGLFKERSIAPEMKLFNGFKYMKKLFINCFEEDIKLYFAMQLRNRINSEVVLGCIGYVLLFSTYIILLYPLSNNVISIGFYIATINAVSRLVLFITKSLPQSLQYLFKSRYYWKEVESFFALSETDYEGVKKNNLQSFQQIKFDNIYFKYPNSNQYILKGVSFTIESGKHYAVVGKNGAGKSTIIKLLTGLYQVDQGQITIDGVNINDFNTREISNLFSVVFQDFGKYNVSVMDNIQLSNLTSKSDLTRIDSIAHNLGFLETIKKMPNGYSSVLGKLTEGGIDLSGGEWQKLALCRSVYSNACIRILDEPTAALDPVAETKLYQLFEDSLSDNSSTIFISHRLGSTKLADQIILIDNGIVKEQGSHNELMSRKGLYKRMFDSQKLWYS